MSYDRPKYAKDVTCLYCGQITGYSLDYERKTVGSCCVWGKRDEGREVSAGMRPWVRPLSFWVHFFHSTPMPDADAKIAHTLWDNQQEEIRQRNATSCAMRF